VVVRAVRKRYPIIGPCLLSIFDAHSLGIQARPTARRHDSSLSPLRRYLASVRKPDQLAIDRGPRRTVRRKSREIKNLSLTLFREIAAIAARKRTKGDENYQKAYFSWLQNIDFEKKFGVQGDKSWPGYW
jgi:hypothetical protein